MTRFVKELALPEYDAEILTRDTQLANYVEEAVKEGSKQNVTAKQIANTIIHKKIDVANVSVEELLKQILQTSQVASIDEEELQQIIEAVMKENEQAVNDYKGGKLTTIMFLVGQVMRKAGKKIDAQMVKEKLEKKLQ